MKRSDDHDGNEDKPRVHGSMGRLVRDKDALAALYRRHGIRCLSLFGSALKGTVRPDSDIDLLVEFEPQSVPGLLDMAAIQAELSELVGGRRKLERRPLAGPACIIIAEAV